MDSNNFYYQIYQKKTTNELNDIISNVNSDVDSKLISIQILEDRGELKDEVMALKLELDKKRLDLLTTTIAVDRYNTFSSRFVANMIDGFILRTIGFVIDYLENSGSLITAISVFLPFLYTILLQGFTGQTIGKMAMGIKIFDKNEKSKISFFQAILRDAIPLGLTFVVWFQFTINSSNNPESFSDYSIILMYIIVIWAILEIVTLLFNKKHRALHDFIAGTIVLKIRER